MPAPPFKAWRLAALAALLGAGGCVGTVGGTSSPGDGTGSAAGSGPGPGGAGTGVANPAGAAGSGNMTGVAGTGAVAGPCTQGASLASARVWRITDQQYVNVVSQVFGVRPPAEITEADTAPAEFENFSEAPALTVQANTVSAYQIAARNAAYSAVTQNMKVFLPCGSTSPTDACVEQFIRNRVARAFGRPLTATEVTDLLGVYHTGAMESVPMGMRLVIEATLQSPSFLYRTELGAPSATLGGPTGKATLTSFELAGAVAFALLDSIPDDQLWARAQDGTLTQPAVLAQEVDRLLTTPAVRANLASKAGFWLGIEKLRSIVPKNTTIFPEFTAQVKDDLYRSAQLFVQDLFNNGDIGDLLSSRRMYLNANLAKVYGIAGVTSTSLVPVDGPDSRAAGILTQPAVLAAWSHPDRGDAIHRGLFIYNSLVCGANIPPPPANATAVAAGFPKDATERELAGLRATNPAGCGSCHGSFDPLGLATEQYDPIGRYTPTDAKGQPIDASATLRLGTDLSGMISGLPDLVTKLQQGRRLADCASRNMAPFVLGRTVVTDNSCALQTVKDTFATSGSFTDFYRAMLTSPAFLTRDVEP
jgi:hypothetical protein